MKTGGWIDVSSTNAVEPTYHGKIYIYIIRFGISCRATHISQTKLVNKRASNVYMYHEEQRFPTTTRSLEFRLRGIIAIMLCCGFVSLPGLLFTCSVVYLCNLSTSILTQVGAP